MASLPRAPALEDPNSSSAAHAWTFLSAGEFAESLSACWPAGEWVTDMKHGQGTMEYANGNRYTGQWVGDVKCGQGTMHWVDRQQKYSGEWRDHLPNGVGEHTYLHNPPDATSAKSTTITFFVYNRWGLK